MNTVRLKLSTLNLPRAGLAIPWGTLGLRTTALVYLTVLLIVPILVILRDGLREGFAGLWYQVNMPVARHALLLSIWTSAVMTVINTVMGLITAYVLVRYKFAMQSWLNAIIDLPLAIPSLVTGVMLVFLYGPQQVIGGWLKQNLGLSIIFAPPGIILALLFITFPFVVRTVQPVLAALDQTQEQAAATLGASPWMIFWKIVFPPLLLPMTAGALLSFARAMGEFGAIVIVAGNIPLSTMTAAVYVLGEVESENRIGASAVSIVMVWISLVTILLVNYIHQRTKRPAK